MSKLVVTGGQKLMGEITVEGAKNAVLPILAAAILNNDISVIKNCPRLRDVEIMLEILNRIGCRTSFEGSIVTVDSSTANCTEIPEELVTEMRSSIIFMGPMLSRFKKVTISYPGGCVASLAQQLTLSAVYAPTCEIYALSNRLSPELCVQDRILSPPMKRKPTPV